MRRGLQISIPGTLTILFLLLAASFWLGWWERPPALQPVTPADPSFADPTTVRLSAAELYRLDGDVSMFSCYACHDRDEPAPILEFDDVGNVIFEEHEVDFELRHGRNHRNEHCYACHAAENLELLKTPAGLTFTLEESSHHCGSCHGTSYRDWEVGIHGRVSGYWDRALGEAFRQDCTSCHDPHAPAFPSIEPAPAPQRLRLAPGDAVLLEVEEDDVVEG
jgi:hypothetical protein